MVARLITVRILSDQTGDVGLLTARGFGGGCEQTVEFSIRCIGTTHHADHSRNVLWNEERVLPAIRLGEVVVDLTRVEPGKPVAVASRTHEACPWFIHVPVRSRPTVVRACIVCLAKDASHFRDAPVIVGILKGL